MSRVDCAECHYVNRIKCCDYYDFGFMPCHEIPIGRCPSEWDDWNDQEDES